MKTCIFIDPWCEQKQGLCQSFPEGTSNIHFQVEAGQVMRNVVSHCMPPLQQQLGEK